jgi:plasmid maintenance system antidote protein VapI
MATERSARLPAFQPAHPGEILREDVLPGLDLRAPSLRSISVYLARRSTTLSTRSAQ